MYLRGLSAGSDAYWSPTDSGISPADCRASGGVPEMGFCNVLTINGQPDRGQGAVCHWKCNYPPAPAYVPAPASSFVISVPTTVQTQVSPQISPVLIQQEHPSNSPIDAGTAQVAPSAQSAAPGSVSGPDPSFYDYLKSLQAEQDSRDREMLDFLKSQTMLPQSVAPDGSASTISTQSYMPPAPIEQAGVTTNAGLSPAQTLEKIAPLLIAAGALFYVATRKKKRS